MAVDRRRVPGEVRAALFFLAPGLLVIGLFFLLPIAASVLLSLTDFDIYALGDVRNVRVVGLRNFSRLLADPLFWTSLRNTFYFVLVGGPLTLSVALAAALLLHSKLVRWKGLFRTIFFAPYITTLVAVAIVFRYLYHPRFGGLNRVLELFGIPAIDWLGNPKWSMPAIILFIAGLQAIPKSLYEAARLDGAGRLQLFRRITVPMLAPTFLFLGVLTTIGYFQFFAEPYVMTGGGGPLNATLSTGLLMYKQGFRWWNMGYAAAIAVVLGLVILAFSALQFRIERRRNA